jgi:hypothetical protein
MTVHWVEWTGVRTCTYLPTIRISLGPPGLTLPHESSFCRRKYVGFIDVRGVVYSLAYRSLPRIRCLRRNQEAPGFKREQTRAPNPVSSRLILQR